MYSTLNADIKFAAQEAMIVHMTLYVSMSTVIHSSFELLTDGTVVCCSDTAEALQSRSEPLPIIFADICRGMFLKMLMLHSVTVTNT